MIVEEKYGEANLSNQTTGQGLKEIDQKPIEKNLKHSSAKTERVIVLKVMIEAPKRCK